MRSFGPSTNEEPTRDRLLAAAVVKASGDLALAVERDRPLLGGAHHRHVLEQVCPVGLRQVAGIGYERDVLAFCAMAAAVIRAAAYDYAIDWLHLSALRVWPPFGISSGNRAWLSPLRDLLRGALWTMGARGSARAPYV